MNMNVDKFLSKWKNKSIEDYGVTVSPEYNKFQNDYRRMLSEIGKDANMKLHKFNKNHYCFSAVLQSEATDKFYYISVGDVRYFNDDWANHILYRTMEHDKDWRGGSNRYSSLEKLGENLSGLDKQFVKFENIRQSNSEEMEME